MPDNIEIRHIRLDGGTQPRADINQEVVADYAQELKEGANFPPVVLFHDGSNYWLADGFHRVAAYKFAQKQRIPADIRQGTLRDARLYCAGANASHGLRRSREDKRRAVEMILDDPEWGKLPNREIARHCKVSHTFVANVIADREKQGIQRHEDGKGGNVASNGEDGKGGNVASKELTEILRAYLEKEYNTKEPAVLAVMARALSSKREHCLTIETRLRLYKPGQGPEGVRIALIQLAQELQSYVPNQQHPGNGTSWMIPALADLINGIKQLSPDAAYQARQWCEGISVDNRAKTHAHIWDSMEKLICALRPS